MNQAVVTQKIFLSLLLLSLLPALLKYSQCLKVDNNSNGPSIQPLRLEKSGWRTISTDSEPPPTTNSTGNSELAASDEPEVERPPKIATSRSKNLIEWDDDENLMNELNLARENKLRNQQDERFLLNANQRQVNDSSSINTDDHKLSSPFVARSHQTRSSRRKSINGSNNNSAKKFSRLVYHGQVKDNLTMRMFDGLKLHVNIHKPLTIRRRSYESLFAAKQQKQQLNQFAPSTSDDEEKEPASSLKAKRRDELEAIKVVSVKLADETPERKTQPLVELSSSSDWKPIVSTAATATTSTSTQRSRRSNQKALNATDIPPSKVANTSPEQSAQSEFKWKPIKSTFKSASADSAGVVYGKKSSVAPTGIVSSLEEPFDDDGIIVTRKSFDLAGKKKQREAKVAVIKQQEATAQQLFDSRWTPVDLTTTEATITTTTTTVAPSTGAVVTAATNSSNAESAQKSASDLNYIYSSQPLVSQSQQLQSTGDWFSPSSGRQQQATSGGYYSSGSYQSQQQQPPVTEQTLAPAIIDTVSGQLPEMVPERVDPSVQQSSGGFGDVTNGYSMPANSATFQPAQPPPVRYDPTGYYGNVNSYANSYRPQPSPPVRQTAPTVAPQREIVRQEHHYHYYNQQQQQDRQQQQQQDRQLQQQPVQQVQQQMPSVIRELQPIMISQPIIQQQQQPTTSTTAAPTQIIREIIREVPAQQQNTLQTAQIQTIQIPRIVLPQSVPMSRELDPSVSFSYGNGGGGERQQQPSIAPTAQRLIRQISGGLPGVGMRIQPTIRLPIPTIQLPVRLGQSNQAPVTRQTGSFVIPPMPKQTTTYMTETQQVPTHTTIMHTTQFTPATRTTVYTTDHQPQPQTMAAATGYRRR